MRQIDHAADAIDEHIAAGDQRVDRRKHHDVDDELQAATLERSPPRMRAGRMSDLFHVVGEPVLDQRDLGRRPNGRRDNIAWVRK